jgi:hypothetical protein
MTQYIVHLYREMRLSFTGIEAETPFAAARVARGKSTDDADNIEDCEGRNLSALVDIAGDEDFSQSVTIDFEPERLGKVAAKLLDSLRIASGIVQWAKDHGADREATEAVRTYIRSAITEAEKQNLGQPSRFEIEHDPLENPARAYVLVDSLYDVAILRTSEGIVIDVYPKGWIDPIDNMTITDDQVAELDEAAAQD